MFLANSIGGNFLCLLCLPLLVRAVEELHCSKFDFEEKVLEKMVRMEFTMEQMKTEVTEAVKTVLNLNSEVGSKLSDFDNVQNMFREEIRAETKMLQNRIENVLERNVEEINKLQDLTFAPKLAFRVVLKHSIDVNTGDVLKFPDVQHNKGGYDPNTGVFTTSVNGSYVFSHRLCLYNDKSVKTSLMVDGTEQDVVTFYGNEGHTCYSSETAIVLKAEQKVWLQVNYSSGSGYKIGGDSTRWNTFSGRLV